MRHQHQLPGWNVVRCFPGIWCPFCLVRSVLKVWPLVPPPKRPSKVPGKDTKTVYKNGKAWDLFSWDLMLWLSHLRASPPTLSMWPCTGNLGWGSLVKSSKSTGRFARALEKTTAFRAREHYNKTESNHVQGLLLVSDWLDSLIRPSGLELVVSHLLAVPVLWVGLKNI